MATVKLNKLIPVMLCFFAMGFVDLVGIASNYVKADLATSSLPWYSSGFLYSRCRPEF